MNMRKSTQSFLITFMPFYFLLITCSFASHNGWEFTIRHACTQSSLEQSNVESDKLEYGSKEWHQEKKKLNVMLWTAIVVVTILFTGFILVTLIRMGRHYRQRFTEDKKPEPTQYVDAWSQYRLPEEKDSEPPKES